MFPIANSVRLMRVLGLAVMVLGLGLALLGRVMVALHQAWLLLPAVLLTLALVICVCVVAWRVAKPFDLRRALPLRMLFEPLGSILVRLMLMAMMPSVGVAVSSVLAGTAAPGTLTGSAL